MFNVKILPQMYWATWLVDHTRIVGTFHRLEKNHFFSLWIVYSFDYIPLHTEEEQHSKINEVLKVSFFKLMNLKFKFQNFICKWYWFLWQNLAGREDFNSDSFTSHIYNLFPTTIFNIILLCFFSIFQVTIPKILSSKSYTQFCLPHPILWETSFITVTKIGHFYHLQSPVLHKILYSPLRSEYSLNKFVAICLKFMLSSKV
jgi:hypothetical protein